jgi:hypothetical protein
VGQQVWLWAAAAAGLSAVFARVGMHRPGPLGPLGPLRAE